MWSIVKKTLDKQAINVEPLKNRKGWRTIRIFVSSTFKDFHHEKEVLVKEVFPDLRLWCEQRKLQLVECDLCWGVPKDSTTEETIKICLSELDRCYEDNVSPFFLILAG
ncbi:telomerase protein component 1 [Hydra vulgaris]|uniref:telomerase protein component 1 n=1 Tax=Hydra vulgaris TaxID=6087 RepID=UPI001F5F4FC1|nr:telomerase protein component 1-like [Hydra vulgaris]